MIDFQKMTSDDFRYQVYLADDGKTLIHLIVPPHIDSPN